jgi:hypothetical protein
MKKGWGISPALVFIYSNILTRNNHAFLLHQILAHIITGNPALFEHFLDVDFIVNEWENQP